MSPQDDKERQVSERVVSSSTPKGSSYEFELFKLEFQNLAEGYRHTYATIWQAGSVLTAISAALLAFSSSSSTIPAIWIWPIPFFFWWIGIFTPMDRYGKLRLQRLEELEDYAQRKFPSGDFKMNHFCYMGESLKKTQKLLAFSRLRVGYMVDIFGIIVLVTWFSPLFLMIVS